MVNTNRELFLATLDNDLNRVSTWLARGANVNAPDKSVGEPPLFAAVPMWSDPAIANLLIAQGADVQLRAEHGETALHRAALFGDATMIRLLLEHGADINALDDLGRTPLHCAANLGRVQETAFLVSRGANRAIRDHSGCTPADLVKESSVIARMELLNALSGRSFRL
jgi:ankyrin repeat protein